MPSNARPRSTDHADLPPAVLGQGAHRLDRRRAPRVPAFGVAQGAFTDGHGRFGVVRLELVDRSFGGLGARSDTRLTPGTRVALNAGALTAVVVRCEPEARAFRLGLAYPASTAAA
jgi:ferric-dicitrate binding protein FerR (iron transport regulator)